MSYHIHTSHGLRDGQRLTKTTDFHQTPSGALLDFLGEQAWQKLTVHPLPGHPTRRDTTRSGKLIWLTGRESEAAILNTYLYISSFFG